jgi:predicted nucleic acid-binding protein
VTSGFLDTSVLVDVGRGYQPATFWLSSQPLLAIVPTVRMELVAGAKNKTEQMKAIRLAAKFQMIYFTQVDLDWAMQQVIYTLSHNVGMNDCLIACIAHRLQLPLYTTNLKHFAPLLDSLAQKPY